MAGVYQRKRIPLQAIVLRALAGTATLGVLALAPKMSTLLKEFDRPAKSRASLYNRLNGALARLERQGLIVVSGTRGSQRVTLTVKGRAKAQDVNYLDTAITEPAFWYGKWRVLIFDMVERRRATRDRLRRILQSAGFFRLQDSVWIHPYPCDDFIALVRAYLKSGVGEMRYLVAQRRSNPTKRSENIFVLSDYYTYSSYRKNKCISRLR